MEVSLWRIRNSFSVVPFYCLFRALFIIFIMLSFIIFIIFFPSFLSFFISSTVYSSFLHTPKNTRTLYPAYVLIHTYNICMYIQFINACILHRRKKNTHKEIRIDIETKKIKIKRKRNRRITKKFGNSRTSKADSVSGALNFVFVMTFNFERTCDGKYGTLRVANPLINTQDKFHVITDNKLICISSWLRYANISTCIEAFFIRI